MTFDLIILDLNMPVTDGFEACEKILKLCSISSISNNNKSAKIMGNNMEVYKPHIVAVSSYIDSKTYTKAQESGFDQILEMPLSNDSIVNNILPKLSERESRI